MADERGQHVTPGSNAPTVSIGLPVYNGSRFIRKAIDSMLAQTLTDFELIIVDNASTDDTVEICREYAQRDERVRLIENEKNLGAAPNFNKAFHLATGKYFKWLAHDDWNEPTYLEKCVKALESDPDVSLCHSRTALYDENETFQEYYADALDGMNADPRKRFMSTLRDMRKVYPVFGVMRREQVAQTMLMGANPGADHTFVAEMALTGKICLLPEYLYANRTTSSARDVRDQRSWWDSSSRAHYRPKYILLAKQHLSAIRRSSLSRLDKLTLSLKTVRHFLTSRRFIVFREMKHYVWSRTPLR